MEYPGRGIIEGMAPDGRLFVAYILTGRSPPSKARRLELRAEDGCVSIETVPTDEAVLRMGNPKLLRYPAIIANARKIAISNGAQTTPVMRAQLPDALKGPVIIDGIDVSCYEPDEPNFTPRITGEVRPSQLVSIFHKIRKEEGSSNPISETYRYELKPGMAGMMTTYAGENKSPLPPFLGPPMEMAMALNGSQELCKHLFSMLNGAYRVSTAVLIWAKTEGGVMADVSILNASDNTDEPQRSEVLLRYA